MPIVDPTPSEPQWVTTGLRVVRSQIDLGVWMLDPASWYEGSYVIAGSWDQLTAYVREHMRPGFDYELRVEPNDSTATVWRRSKIGAST